ncbi:hypothetical protein BJX65DRAFT_294205 [Aspergillus insuetus]
MSPMPHPLPEYEKAELPHLLAGRGPESRSPNEIGTHDYSRPPRAVSFGRGYEPQKVEELEKKFAADLPAGAAGPDYAQNIAADMKKVLHEWRDGGGKDEEILVY